MDVDQQGNTGKKEIKINKQGNKGKTGNKSDLAST
jgi:hypothetical protein